jgi:two-component system phosphate regulon sensor histidine kinase PhoR
MTKNKPLLIIAFFLLVSILIAIYFQFTLVKKTYVDKKIDLDYEFVESIEHSLYLVENEKENKKISHEDFHTNITSYIVKTYDYDYEMSKEEFDEYNESILSDDYSYKMEFDNSYFPQMKGFLNDSINEKELKVDYEIKFLEGLSYQNYDTLFADSDLLICYTFGTFSVRFKNEKPVLIAEIKNIILSSLFFIITIIFCGTLLIKKYLNEKKLSLYKNEFINNLTHELQTPLTVSILALEKLTIDLKDNNQLSKYVDIVGKENNKIEKLTKRILKLAELKTIVSKNEEIDVSESIQNIISRYESLLESEDVLLTDLNHFELKLKGSEERFLDLLDNLLSNAIKYTTSPRKILVKTNIKNGMFHLSIKDNGMGIPNEFEDKIFSPFFKVPNNDTHEIKSHGLGLSYVAEIVKQMNGEITMTSELNKGTTFNVILPYEN